MSTNYKRAIFIRVPKTAGLSIVQCTKSLNIECIGHRKSHQFSKEQLEKSFVFSFVRNPYDRFISAFFYLQQGGMNQMDRNIASILPNNIQQCVELIKSMGDSFIYKKQRLLHFEPQYFWHTEKIDFIGKYENLTGDFSLICDKISDKKITLPHINKSNSKHYSQYLTIKLIDCINQRFYKDFDKYNYSMI